MGMYYIVEGRGAGLMSGDFCGMYRFDDRAGVIAASAQSRYGAGAMADVVSSRYRSGDVYVVTMSDGGQWYVVEHWRAGICLARMAGRGGESLYDTPVLWSSHHVTAIPVPVVAPAPAPAPAPVVKLGRVARFFAWLGW